VIIKLVSSAPPRAREPRRELGPRTPIWSVNALDNEEFAADGYARLVRRVGRVVADDRELAGLLGSQTRGAGTAGR
jgi:hypothetical protein